MEAEEVSNGEIANAMDREAITHTENLINRVMQTRAIIIITITVTVDGAERNTDKGTVTVKVTKEIYIYGSGRASGRTTKGNASGRLSSAANDDAATKK